MKTRTILLISAFVLFFGCSHPFLNSPVSDNAGITQSSGDEPASLIAKNEEFNNNESFQSNTPQFETENAAEEQTDKDENTSIKDTETARTTTSDSSIKTDKGKCKIPSSTESFKDVANSDEADKTVVDNRSVDASASENNTRNVLPEKSVETKLDEALDYCHLSQEYWQKGELEKAIDILDQAYSVIIDIDTDERPIQQIDDLRFAISKRILEIYASRNIVVNGNHNAIPVILNKHVQSEIKCFTVGAEKKFFQESFKRSGRYRPQIEAELKKAGLPTELSWLPLIESGFKVNALSKSRALGLWQFIPSTGYKFGLKRDKFIDERLDPTKALMAAIDYLKELHQIFGDWATVLAAYNCGEGRVLRVIRNQNVNYLDNFWDLYERLPRETARYVPRFLATLHIVNNPSKYGLDSVIVDEPLPHETVTISKKIHLRNIAKALSVPQRLLKELNPELRYSIVPDHKYQLKVPRDKGKILLANLDKIPVSTPPSRTYIYHKVRSGETLSSIAQKYHTNVSNIARANRISRNKYK